MVLAEAYHFLARFMTFISRNGMAENHLKTTLMFGLTDSFLCRSLVAKPNSDHRQSGMDSFYGQP